jgi:hypothetical protein
MEPNGATEAHARQVIWQFLLARRAQAGRRRHYLVSYPRSGSTLVRSYFAILQGVPQLSVYADDFVGAGGVALAPALQDLDLVKSHEWPPGDEPIVYLVRDGRNAMLSHLQMTALFGGHGFARLDEVREAIQWLDAQEGSWSRHVAAALAQRRHRPVLFVRYEDIVAAPEAALAEIIGFMDASVAPAILGEAVARHREADRYAENPYNGFRNTPPEGSIFDLLQKHRRGAYWRHILDAPSRRYLHETGATELLMQFGYERSPHWWRDGSDQGV